MYHLVEVCLNGLVLLGEIEEVEVGTMVVGEGGGGFFERVHDD